MDFFENYKKQIFSIITVFLVITAFITAGKNSRIPLIQNAVNLVITPVQKISTSITSWVDDKIESWTTSTDYVTENATLKEEIARLQAENKRLALFEDRNLVLSGLLDITQRYAKLDTTGALIIAKDPGNWYNVFTIDKGTSQGMQTNMVLMTTEGVVGKIVSTDLVSSQAQSILDSRSSISAMSLRTGDLGVVKGDYSLMSSGLCIMEYINPEAEIIEGDEIVTSHISDIYPEGLSIGYVKEVTISSNGLTKHAIIEPHVDFEHLDTVLVVKGSDTSVAEPTPEEE